MDAEISKRIEFLESENKRIRDKQLTIDIVLFGDTAKGIEGLLQRTDKFRIILDAHTRNFNWAVGGWFVIGAVVAGAHLYTGLNP